MDIFELAAGVAAGVIAAGVFGWCVRCIAVDETNGKRPQMRHMLAMLVVIAFITLSFISAL